MLFFRLDDLHASVFIFHIQHSTEPTFRRLVLFLRILLSLIGLKGTQELESNAAILDPIFWELTISYRGSSNKWVVIDNYRQFSYQKTDKEGKPLGNPIPIEGPSLSKISTTP